MSNRDLKIILNKIEELEDLDIEIEADDEDDALTIHLFSREEFEEGQLGFRVDPEGNSLLGNSKGDWKESWYVIGYDELLGDPIFIDINNKNYPVMTAMHGEGNWEPELMFSSLNNFLEAIL